MRVLLRQAFLSVRVQVRIRLSLDTEPVVVVQVHRTLGA